MHFSDKQSHAVLNQLLRINNERGSGYGRACLQTDVSILQVLFERLRETSEICSEELCYEIYKLGGTPSPGKQKGQFEIAWKEISNALITNDHKALLESCYLEEFMTYKSYEYALRYFENHITSQQASLVARQYQLLKEDHSKVKNLRDVLLNAA